MTERHLLLETWDRLLAEHTPNFLRLYLAPTAVKTCYCLSEYVRESWYKDDPGNREFQSFLANSFDEALSGAIKLARYVAATENRPKAGLILDAENRIGPLVGVSLEGLGKLEFLPEVSVVGAEELKDTKSLSQLDRFGFLVVFPSTNAETLPALSILAHATRLPPVIVCLDRAGLTLCRDRKDALWSALRPSIVVFDESFVRKHVPFGAFTATKAFYDHWNKPGFANFHSTTFQPNAVSTLHFMQCAREDDPDFLARHASELKQIEVDAVYRKRLFRRLYSPSIARTAALVGWDRKSVRGSGHYVRVDERPIFDAVAGVACSIRGHNPPRFCQEIEELGELPYYHQVLVGRMQQLTGLPNLLPAVSGASAVENALRLGLIAEYPRNYVIAFQGGFGGKTLLALTGTASAAYKRRIEPLYPNVIYIDPFKADAIDTMEAVLANHPVGLVQAELIQAVGGVRHLPEKLLLYLQDAKARFGYSLFIDEVQTGMFRTGPFLRSKGLGLKPDLVTIGKGASDMMFPFAVTLFSETIREKVESKNSGILDAMRSRLDHEFGYKTLLNVLDQVEKANLPQHVSRVSRLIEDRLKSGLAKCRAVREIRVFGLLIAIELEVNRGLRKWLGKQTGPAYILNILRHATFPVLSGYCQYEPHVLKLTPPLSITDEEAERLCCTVVDVLNRPAFALLPPLLGALSNSLVRRK